MSAGPPDDSDDDQSLKQDNDGKKHKHKHKHKGAKTHKKKSIVLFICDPQCDYLADGSIPIPNARTDSARLGDMINAHHADIHEIFVSLNSRHKTHISNPISWVNLDGSTPQPFITILKSDVEKGIYRARMPTLQESFLEYVTSLELAEREPLILWPDHCLVGTEGHAVIPQVNEALQDWAGRNMYTVEYILKASSCATEMYSAISAEVPQASDPSTSLDTGIVERLMSADRVLICGISLSHAVKHTVKDLLKLWKENLRSNIYLVKDCCSTLPGFEGKADDFIREMLQSGVTVVNASDAFAWPELATATPSSAAAEQNKAGDR